VIGTNTQKAASEYRLAQWAQMMQTRKENGQSINDFCQTMCVSKNTYFYWQRKLREVACEELSVRAQRERDEPEGPLVPSGWAVCTTAEPAAQGKSMVIEINGCRVHVEADAATEQLVKVFRVLKSL